jgi:nucleotidyltransferase/DNA polymerase involved in DNA repair
VKDEVALHRTMRQQAEGVGRRLRQHNLSGTTVKIKVRWADFTTLTRQVTLSRPTNLDNEIYGAALELFEKTWPPGKRVRLIGVGVSGFETPTYQLGLWDQAPIEEDQRLQSTLDELRQRFGDKAIRRGNQLEADEP